MLVRFCSLGDIRAFNSEDLAHRHKVKAFCEILVDYTSAGHFEIYDQLVREGNDFQDNDGLHRASELLNTIDGTTQRILDFNDKYLETDDLSALARDLSNLGESLSARMEAEDSMIEVLHTAHRSKLAL